MRAIMFGLSLDVTGFSTSTIELESLVEYRCSTLHHLMHRLSCCVRSVSLITINFSTPYNQPLYQSIRITLTLFHCYWTIVSRVRRCLCKKDR